MNGPEESDFMELGETGWVPMPDGTLVNIAKDQMIDENGNTYTLDGMTIEGDLEDIDDIKE